MKAHLTVNALDNAISRRPGTAGCIVHSDRGSQFRSRTFVHALNRHHLTGSMRKAGAAGDSAAMESSFALLQKNVMNRKRWRTREELRIADHHLDRTHLPPSSPAGSPGSIDPDRVRDHYEPDCQYGGLTPADI